jgi:hypothetical protein
LDFKNLHPPQSIVPIIELETDDINRNNRNNHNNTHIVFFVCDTASSENVKERSYVTVIAKLRNTVESLALSLSVLLSFEQLRRISRSDAWIRNQIRQVAENHDDAPGIYCWG